MIKKFFQSKKFLWFVFVLYLVITGILVINHNPWRDEAQSWLIARDLNVVEIIKQMPYEGTPPLWHLILHPFAAAGAPYETQALLAYLCMAAAVFLLLFKSPLPLFVKILTPFSFYFIFQYSVISRHYGLMVFCLFIVAYLYRQRLTKPYLYAAAIFLLTWSGIQTAAIGSLLSLLFIKDIIKKYTWKKIPYKYYLAIAVMLVASLAVFLMLQEKSIQAWGGISYFGWQRAPQAFVKGLLPFFISLSHSISIFIILSITLLSAIILVLKNWTSRLIFIFALSWLSFIFIFKHHGHYYHFGLILIFFLFAWWLGELDKKVNHQKLNYFIYPLISLIFLTSVAYSFYFLNKNYHYRYSSSKIIVNYIKEKGLSEKPFVAFAGHFGSTLLPYFPEQKMFLADIKQMATFMTWDQNWQQRRRWSYADKKTNTITFYQKLNPTPDSVLVIMDKEVNDPDLKLLKNYSERIISDENIFLYEMIIPPFDHSLPYGQK